MTDPAVTEIVIEQGKALVRVVEVVVGMEWSGGVRGWWSGEGRVWLSVYHQELDKNANIEGRSLDESVTKTYCIT